MAKMKNILDNLSGFTIAEMLVSVSIIALVSGIALANYHEGNQVAKLNSETYKLANLVREVQDWALGSKEDQAGNLPGAWGLEFSDQNGDNAAVRIVRFDVLDGELTAAATERAVPFADGVTVGDLDAGGAHPTKAYLAFMPPDPDTRICQNDLTPANCAAVSFDIILHDRFSAKSRTITVNTFGLIDVD